MAPKRVVEEAAKRRKAILRFIRDYRRRYGYAPTVQEIAAKAGLKSANAARGHLQVLQREGYLTVAPKIARGLSLADPAPDGWTSR